MNAEAQTASTPIELYRRGLSALQEQLGHVDSIRFLHLFDPAPEILPLNGRPGRTKADWTRCARRFGRPA